VWSIMRRGAGAVEQCAHHEAWSIMRRGAGAVCLRKSAKVWSSS